MTLKIWWDTPFKVIFGNQCTSCDTEVFFQIQDCSEGTCSHGALPDKELKQIRNWWKLQYCHLSKKTWSQSGPIVYDDSQSKDFEQMYKNYNASLGIRNRCQLLCIPRCNQCLALSYNIAGHKNWTSCQAKVPYYHWQHIGEFYRVLVGLWLPIMEYVLRM
jgi:hypothetical protein